MAVSGVGSTGPTPEVRNSKAEREPRDRDPVEARRRESPSDRGRVESRNSDGDRAEVSRGR